MKKAQTLFLTLLLSLTFYAPKNAQAAAGDELIFGGLISLPCVVGAGAALMAGGTKAACIEGLSIGGGLSAALGAVYCATSTGCLQCALFECAYGYEKLKEKLGNCMSCFSRGDDSVEQRVADQGRFPPSMPQMMKPMGEEAEDRRAEAL